MDESIRSVVAARGGFRCEYCRLDAESDVYSFHVEHIVAIKHGGSNDLDNLAYACQYCNLHKGSNLSGIDPTTDIVSVLFHPRRDVWSDHFTTDQFRIVGLTPVGRATVRVLAMNDPDRVHLRSLVDE